MRQRIDINHETLRNGATPPRVTVVTQQVTCT
jgi:hypothetical protein